MSNDPLDDAFDGGPQGPGKQAGAPSGDPLDSAYDSNDPLDVMFNAHKQLDTHINARNLLRSAGQGATFGFSDELGLADRGAEEAFEKAHPFMDMGAKILGGAVAPAVAVAAAPEALATAGGAAALGGGLGALTGIGEGDNAHDRTVGGITGGIGGALLGLLGHGAGKLFGSVAGSVADRAHPARAVARAASDLLDGEADKVGATMDEVNKLAPGGASVYSSSVGPVSGKSRFLSMVRGVGANPKAAASVEGALQTQKQALRQGGRQLGAQMDQLDTDVPVTKSLRDALQKARGVLGAKTPVVPPDVEEEANPLGIERNAPVSVNTDAPTISVQQLRDALSRLRYMSRVAGKRGVEGNGMTLQDITDARDAIQKEVYAAAPDYAKLDRQYALLSDQMRQVHQGLKTTELSRQNYAGNEAYGASAGSLGGSLPKGAHGVTMALLDKILTDKAGAADAVRRMVVAPGTSASVRGLMSTAPKTASLAGTAVRGGLLGASAAQLPAALRGLLTSGDVQP